MNNFARRTSQTAPALQNLGWVPATAKADGRPALRASVEMVSSPTWTVARLWSTAATLHATPRKAKSHRILLGADGEATVSTGSKNQTLRAQQLIVLDGASTVATKNHGVWARYEWHMQSPLFDQEDVVRHCARPIDIKPEYFKVLTSMANAVCVAQGLNGDPCAPILLSAFASSIYAAIKSSIDGNSMLSPGRSALVAAAQQHIEENYADPNFDVAALVKQLAVSRGLLHRAFAAAGTTPRRALEEKRVLCAISLLDSIPAKGVNTYVEVAEQSGFTSTRQMRNAMARFSNGESE
jgi:AraC-like DNA-binding protein